MFALREYGEADVAQIADYLERVGWTKYALIPERIEVTLQEMIDEGIVKRIKPE